MLTEEQKQQILNSPNFRALINKPTQPTNTGSSFVERARQAREQATPPVAPTLPTQKKEGFFSRVKETGSDIFQAVKGAGEAVETRAKNIGEDVKEVVSGDVNPVRGILRSAGEVGGLFQDIAGEVYGGVARALVSQNTEDKVKEKTVKILENSGAIDALKKGTKVWKDFESKNPQLAEDLKAVGNIGLSALDVVGASGLGAVTKKGVSEVVDVAKGVKNLAKGVVKKGVRTGEQIAEAGKTAKLITKEGVKIAKPIIKAKSPEIAEYAVGQATGLKPETIRKIIDSPEKYTDDILKSVDKESVAKTVKDKIDERVKALSETGKGYNDIRKSADSVIIPEGGLKDILNKNNVSIDVDGKIVTSAESIPLTPTDKKALQQFLDDFGSETELSANSFLNARTALSNMSAFESGKSSASTAMAKQLRKFYDNLGKDQIDGLKVLDNTYSAETGILKRVRKDYFDKNGFKDGAVNKISNLSNKEPILKRLEAIIPDIRQQLNVLDVVKDIEYSSGRAVGTYARSAIGAGGIVTGNVPAVVLAIVSTPKVAVPLLRKYGAFKKINGSIIEIIAKSLTDGTKLVGRPLQVMKEFLSTKIDNIKTWVKELKNNQAGFQKLPEFKAKNKLPFKDIEIGERDMIAEQLSKVELVDIKMPYERYKKLENIKDKIEIGNETKADLKEAYDFLYERKLTPEKLAKKAEPLTKEIQKAKADKLSFEEYIVKQEPKSDEVRLYRGLEQKFDKDFDLAKTDAPNGYSTWTDNPELARQYAGKDGLVYEIDLPKKQKGIDLINQDGDRALFLNNEKPAGLNGIKGEEYLLYNDHELYNPDLIKEFKTKSEIKQLWDKE